MGKQKQEQQWSASDYLKRKAKRQEKVEPQWFTNPETGEKFFIRPRGAMAFVVAGQMQHVLTDDAVDGWQQNGLEITKPEGDEENEENEENEDQTEAENLKKLIEQGNRQARIMARVIHESCVIPRIVLDPKQPDELNVSDLEQSDMFFIFRVATGQQAGQPVELQGGESMKLQELKRVPAKPGRRSGTIGRG
jgi:hypothetical protein